MTTAILFGLTITGLIISIKKDKSKTISSIKGAKGMMGNMIWDVIGILLLIGLILAIIPPTTIEGLLGSESGLLATVGAAVTGTITLIPAFIAFPLMGSLKANGAGILTLTAFVTTLTMVGFITYPIESKAFGSDFAIKRNVLSFLFALLIAFGMGVFY